MRTNKVLLAIVVLMVSMAFEKPRIISAAPSTMLTTSLSVTPAEVSAGASVTFSVGVRNGSRSAASGDVVLTVTNSSGEPVFTKSWLGERFAARKTTTFTTSFVTRADMPSGTYMTQAQVQNSSHATDGGATGSFNVTTVTGGSYAFLDNDPVTSWLRYVEGPAGFTINDVAEQVIDASAPSGDNTVFHMGILNSSAYANVYRYQSKPLVNATQFTYRVKFKWSTPSGRTPQALEFPFSLYTGTERLEAAMQWVVGDGQGARWRVWAGPGAGYWTDHDPSGQPWNFFQTLAPDVWHLFTMDVAIQNNRVYYHSFTVDGQEFPVNADYAGVADQTPAQTVIAYQIDNNAHGDAQDVWLDDFTLSWAP